jgi:hypothetical protein
MVTKDTVSEMKIFDDPMGREKKMFLIKREEQLVWSLKTWPLR